MKSSSYLMLTVAFGTALLAGCAEKHGRHQQQQQDILELPDAPAALRVQQGQVLTLVAKGSGVQIYECGVDKEDPNKYKWNFKAPEAELLNAHGKTIGKHYAGPTWESNDGSKVVGKVVASAKEDNPGGISWLLLNSTSNSGYGAFAKTTSIQRLYTASGKAPTDGCDREHAGKEARVTYTAQYYFYD